MPDACLFASTATPEFQRALAAAFAGWIGWFFLVVRVRAPGAELRHARTALAKNCITSACAVVALTATLSTPDWSLPATHATLADLTGLFFTTFEWADLFCYQLFLPALDVSMIVHHALYGAMGLRMGRHCAARVVSLMLLCQELSSVALNVRFLASKESALHSVASVTFACVFIVVRGLLGWIPVLALAHDPRHTADALLVAAAYAMQLRWCLLIARKVARA